jgi:hypothetical protein
LAAERGQTLKNLSYTKYVKKAYTLTPVQIPGLPRILYFHRNPLETELLEQTKELAFLISEMPLETGIKRSTTY